MTSPDNVYSDRFHEDEMGHRRELWQVLCQSWFPRFFPPDARVIDLGAGYCEFINGIPAKEKYAIDRNPDMREHAEDGVTCIVADLEEGLGQFADGAVDRVMASNVFEHLPDRDKLFRCLDAVHRVLAPGGKLVIMQPNVAAVKQRFYDFTDHLLPLTEKGMAEAVHSCGFEIEYLAARFLPYTTKSRYPKWRFLVKLYLMIPVVHRFIGAQMFIVARKRAPAPSPPEAEAADGG